MKEKKEEKRLKERKSKKYSRDIPWAKIKITKFFLLSLFLPFIRPRQALEGRRKRKERAKKKRNSFIFAQGIPSNVILTNGSGSSFMSRILLSFSLFFLFLFFVLFPLGASAKEREKIGKREKKRIR